MKLLKRIESMACTLYFSFTVKISWETSGKSLLELNRNLLQNGKSIHRKNPLLLCIIADFHIKPQGGCDASYCGVYQKHVYMYLYMCIQVFEGVCVCMCVRACVRASMHVSACNWVCVCVCADQVTCLLGGWVLIPSVWQWMLSTPALSPEEARWLPPQMH